ncbi:MAG: hypothetical protein DI536_08470 [Archangium gephyra]|uniref:Uncharacterized protein n=1 Tax=Archangium gephyra TaxID=48 RepID=A0A2W5TLC3_9BACT|nr:MAG: hypothetical protein DI536_08470 [Archangium gephyra]
MNRIKLVPQKQLKAIREVPVRIKGSATGGVGSGAAPRVATHFEARAKQLASKVRGQARFDPSHLQCAMKGTGKGTNTAGAYTWFNVGGRGNDAFDKLRDLISGFFGR